MPDSNKRYYWLKLTESFFTQKEIKQLRRIAGGDVFVIIYLKMLLRSLRDDGKLYYEGIDQDFVSELALDIDEDVENVKVTVAYLQSKGILVNGEPDEYELLTAGEMTGSEGESARRMRKMRSQRLLASQSDRLVTGRDTEIEIELDKEKEIEIETEIEVKNRKRFTPPTVDEVSAYCSEKGYRIDPQRFVDFYESKGWMVGSNRMKDWKASVRGWASREKEKVKNNPALDYTQREYKDRGSVIYKSINDMPDD